MSLQNKHKLISFLYLSTFNYCILYMNFNLLKSKIRFSFLLIALLFFSHITFSQDQLGIYFCGMTIHALGDDNVSLMPLRLDQDGIFVINAGAALQYRKQLRGQWALDMEQTFQADCALKVSWGSGISIGYDFIKSTKHQFIFAIGPGFYFRKSWFDLDGYIPVKELKLSANQKWEYIFVPVIPHFEYIWFPKDKHLGISTYCIFDPIDFLANIGFGVNYKLY